MPLSPNNQPMLTIAILWKKEFLCMVLVPVSHFQTEVCIYAPSHVSKLIFEHKRFTGEKLME